MVSMLVAVAGITNMTPNDVFHRLPAAHTLQYYAASIQQRGLTVVSPSRLVDDLAQLKGIL